MMLVKVKMRESIKAFRERKQAEKEFFFKNKDKIMEFRRKFGASKNDLQHMMENGFRQPRNRDAEMQFDTSQDEIERETVNFSTKFQTVVPKLKMTEVINQKKPTSKIQVNQAKLKQTATLGTTAERIIKHLMQKFELEEIEKGKADDELLQIAGSLEIPTERSLERRYIEDSKRSMDPKTGRSEESALKTDES